MGHVPLDPRWQGYLAATLRRSESVGVGCRLLHRYTQLAETPVLVDEQALVRFLSHEVRSTLVTDLTMEADLDFAEAHQNHGYVRAQCGVRASAWPHVSLTTAMAHHLRTSMAAERRFVRLTDDDLERAAPLWMEWRQQGDRARWLAYRWARRRAVASTQGLRDVLDTVMPPETIHKRPRWRRSL